MVTENIEVFTQSSIRLKGREGIVYADPFRMREEPKDADKFAANVKPPVRVEIKMLDI